MRISRCIGYARVSTDDQTLQLQLDELMAAGCEEIFTDTASGSKADRDGLEEAMGAVGEGDTLIVWRLDRLGRSLRHLVSMIEDLSAHGVHFKSLRDGAIDTTTASGELIFHIFAALAQFERNLIRERTHAGLSAARSRGTVGGRPQLIETNEKVLMAKKLAKAKTLSIAEICGTLQISRATYYRYLRIG